jgi:uncharacterized membrane protein
MLFGWPAVLGLSIGAFVANIFGGLGPIDMVGGALANFIATFLAWKLAKRNSRVWFLVGATVEIVVITLVVGSYLSYLFGVPMQVGLTGVFLGEIVAVGILGTILLFAISDRRVRSLLRTHKLGSLSN